MTMENELNEYFEGQASQIVDAIQSGEIDSLSLACSLKVVWGLGVIDAGRLDDDNKKKIYDTLKNMYPQLIKSEH